MSGREQRRAWVLSRVEAEEMSVVEAARLLGLTTRSVRRLRERMRREGPAGLVHGNRGRASPRRVPAATRTRILELVETTYAEINDSHLAELLAEREGITISRAALRRLLRGAGRAAPRRRRPPGHRSRRDRRAREGMLLQTDGSRHDWLGDRGPRLTLVGMIDDATGRVTAATFREQEDSAGYLTVLAATLRRHGVPGAIYHDRASIFEPPLTTPLTLEDRDGANAFLARYLPRHNRRFTVPATDPEPAWRRLPKGTRIERVCCFKYRRTIARDGTVRAGARSCSCRPGRTDAAVPGSGSSSTSDSTGDSWCGTGSASS